MIFVLNYKHLNQQGTYEDIFLPAAENLINDQIYDYGELDFVKTYPLWGYSIILIPGVLIGQPDIWILFVQLILCLSVINKLYEILPRAPQVKDLLLILPFIGLMSVKWPDAIVAALLFLSVIRIYQFFKGGGRSNLLFAGIYFGLIFNFRSEYLFLPLLFSILLFLLSRKNNQKNYQFLILLISYIFLFPWVIRNYYHTSEIITGSTNGGTVLYISLGQLPNNKWGIEAVDSQADVITKQNGFINQYEKSADDFLKNEFINLVFEDPVEFLKKVSFNTIKVFYGGLYTGEFSNLFIDKELRTEIDLVVNDAKGLDKFEALTLYGDKVLISVLLDKLLRLSYVFLWIFLLLKVSLKLRYNLKNNRSISLILFIVILYKIALAGLIQYEYRHLNSIYLFILILSAISVKQNNNVELT